MLCRPANPATITGQAMSEDFQSFHSANNGRRRGPQYGRLPAAASGKVKAAPRPPMPYWKFLDEQRKEARRGNHPDD